jgi:hypothetical protein
MRHLKTPELVYIFARARGWCPFQTKRFAAYLLATSMCYLISLPNPGTAGPGHINCLPSGDTCIANYGNRETYVTKHSADCIPITPLLDDSYDSTLAPYKMKGIDTDKLVEIIKDGCTPLIRFVQSKSGDADLDLKVIRGTSNDEYSQQGSEIFKLISFLCANSINLRQVW